MAASPIDLSAGLVPKQGAIDLSAGLVPKADSPAPDSRNAFQRGVDELARYVGHPEDRGAGQPNAANRFGEGIVQGALQPLAHPLDSLTGAVESVLHPVNTATAMAHSAAQNPAGFAGQLVGGAALGEGAGAVAAPVADVLAKGAGRAVLLGKTPAEAYESALKPSTTLAPSQRSALVQTGLDKAIPVSKGGLERLGDLIDKYNQQIKDQINSDPTRPIDPNKVATRTDLARAKFANQVNAGGDLSAIEAAKQQFLQEQGAKSVPIGPQGPAPMMNASDAQAMKQGTYQVLKGKFGEQGSASVEAQKALARGLKEEIAIKFPEIGDLNANESRLLDLQPVLERAVNRIGNHQLLGIGTPIAGSAVQAVTGSGSAGAVAAALKGVLDNPLVKSRLAIAVSKGAKIPYAQAAAKVGAYSSTLGDYANGQNADSSATYQNQ